MAVSVSLLYYMDDLHGYQLGRCLQIRLLLSNVLCLFRSYEHTDHTDHNPMGCQITQCKHWQNISVYKFLERHVFFLQSWQFAKGPLTQQYLTYPNRSKIGFSKQNEMLTWDTVRVRPQFIKIIKHMRAHILRCVT